MFHLQAVFLVEEGSIPSVMDQTLEDFGMALGMFKVADLSGKYRSRSCVLVSFSYISAAIITKAGY